MFAVWSLVIGIPRLIAGGRALRLRPSHPIISPSQTSTCIGWDWVCHPRFGRRLELLPLPIPPFTLVSLNSDHIFVSSIFVIASQLPSLSVLSGLHWDIDQHKYEGDKNNAGEGKSSTKGTEAKLEAVTRTISRECIESIEEFKSHR